MIAEFSKIVGISKEDIFSKKRQQKIVEARSLYWSLLWEGGMRTIEIARLFCRNHSCVIYGMRRTNTLLSANDKRMVDMYEKTKHLKYKVNEKG